MSFRWAGTYLGVVALLFGCGPGSDLTIQPGEVEQLDTDRDELCVATGEIKFSVPYQTQKNVGPKNGLYTCTFGVAAMVTQYHHQSTSASFKAFTTKELFEQYIPSQARASFTGFSLSSVFGFEPLDDYRLTAESLYSTKQADLDDIPRRLRNRLCKGPVVAGVPIDRYNNIVASGTYFHAILIVGLSSTSSTITYHDPWAGKSQTMSMDFFKSLAKANASTYLATAAPIFRAYLPIVRN